MMSVAIFGAVFLTGLLGGVHCAGMCGGIVAALSGQGRWRSLASAPGVQPRTDRLLRGGWRAGRHGRQSRSAPGRRAACADRALRPRQPHAGAPRPVPRRGIRRRGEAGADRQLRLWQRIQPLTRGLLPADTLPRALGLGLLWGWLPCGLVYGILLTAVLAGDPLNGAAIMLAFGLGTLPNLLFAGSRLAQGFPASPAPARCAWRRGAWCWGSASTAWPMPPASASTSRAGSSAWAGAAKARRRKGCAKTRLRFSSLDVAYVLHLVR